jgi:death-on-curing protein
VIFLRKSDIILLHHVLVDEFGGAHGLRDEGALESAVVSAENRHHYEQADLPALAATYVYHLTQAHAFVDGNKRVGAGALDLFLELNEHEVEATEDELYDLIMGIADGRHSREDVESWLRPRLCALS